MRSPTQENILSHLKGQQGIDQTATGVPRAKVKETKEMRNSQSLWKGFRNHVGIINIRNIFIHLVDMNPHAAHSSSY